jgi:hypothetical protein
LGVARTLLIVIAAILTLLGTFVFAILPGTLPTLGSGLGFALNLPANFTFTPAPADAIVYYLMLVLFIVWVASGVLQLVGLKSKLVGIIFSLVPLAIGVMLILIEYTTVLGAMSSFFFDMTAADQIGGFLPIYYELFGMGIGVYLLLGGGVLGVIGSSLSKD